MFLKWMLIGIILILFFVSTFCFDFFDCKNIVKGYIKVFKRPDETINYSLMITCGAGSLLLGTVCSFYSCLNDNRLELIILIITVMSSMFFGLVGVMIEIGSKIETIKKNSIERKKLRCILNQTKDILLFEILICGLMLLVSFLTIFTKDFWFAASIFIYSFTILFFINFFILLKEIELLIREILEGK